MPRTRPTQRQRCRARTHRPTLESMQNVSMAPLWTRTSFLLAPRKDGSSRPTRRLSAGQHEGLDDAGMRRCGAASHVRHRSSVAGVRNRTMHLRWENGVRRLLLFRHTIRPSGSDGIRRLARSGCAGAVRRLQSVRHSQEPSSLRANAIEADGCCGDPGDDCDCTRAIATRVMAPAMVTA